MFEKVRRRIERVDDTKAGEFLSMTKFFGQRPLKKRHVKDLEKKMMDGTFLTGDIAYAKLCYNGGETVLVNGQHQCNAVVNTGATIDAVVTEYECYEPEDVSLLYRQFDDNAIRSIQDRIRVEAIALGVDWPANVASLVVASIAFIRGKNAASRNEKVELLKESIAEGAFVNSILAGQSQRSAFIFRIPVVIAMILTWKVSRQDAWKFWISVRDGEELKKTMPEYALRNFLLRVKMSTHKIVQKNTQENVDAKEILARCITAWNAFRKSEKTALKYYADKPIPKAI